jgi:uncharacterized membrane protein (DUF373 family)
MDGKPPIDAVLDPALRHAPEETRLLHLASRTFHRVEQFIYVALGVVLSIAALVSLAGTANLLWAGMQDWTGTEAVFEIIDRLLFVLMLVEILYTVRASMQTGALSSEPFLVVGLIACIRRILVLSLESSNVTKADNWTPQAADLFRAAMTELGVLAGLVIVLVGAIYLIRRLRLN